MDYWYRLKINLPEKFLHLKNEIISYFSEIDQDFPRDCFEKLASYRMPIFKYEEILTCLYEKYNLDNIEILWNVDENELINITYKTWRKAKMSKKNVHIDEFYFLIAELNERRIPEKFIENVRQKNSQFEIFDLNIENESIKESNFDLSKIYNIIFLRIYNIPAFQKCNIVNCKFIDCQFLGTFDFCFFKNSIIINCLWVMLNHCTIFYTKINSMCEITFSKLTKCEFSNKIEKCSEFIHSHLNNCSFNGCFRKLIFLSSLLEKCKINDCTIYKFKFDKSHVSDFCSKIRNLEIQILEVFPPSSILEFDWYNIIKLDNNLCRKAMSYDSNNHPFPEKFTSWSGGGACPYSSCPTQRMILFPERKYYWDPDILGIINPWLLIKKLFVLSNIIVENLDNKL